MRPPSVYHADILVKEAVKQLLKLCNDYADDRLYDTKHNMKTIKDYKKEYEAKFGISSIRYDSISTTEGRLVATSEIWDFFEATIRLILADVALERKPISKHDINMCTGDTFYNEAVKKQFKKREEVLDANT